MEFNQKKLIKLFLAVYLREKVSEYDQEIPRLHTADQPKEVTEH